MWIQSLGQEDPLEEEMATHSSSCLENSMHRGDWQAILHGATKSPQTEHTHTHTRSEWIHKCKIRSIQSELPLVLVAMELLVIFYLNKNLNLLTISNHIPHRKLA